MRWRGYPTHCFSADPGVGSGHAGGFSHCNLDTHFTTGGHRCCDLSTYHATNSRYYSNFGTCSVTADYCSYDFSDYPTADANRDPNSSSCSDPSAYAYTRPQHRLRCPRTGSDFAGMRSK